jgi:hypothetical protein
MELLTYALLKPIVPFLAIVALFAAGWALSDLAAWRLSGRERTIWAFAILVFPPLGSFLYGFMEKKDAAETETG